MSVGQTFLHEWREKDPNSCFHLLQSHPTNSLVSLSRCQKLPSHTQLVVYSHNGFISPSVSVLFCSFCAVTLPLKTGRCWYIMVQNAYMSAQGYTEIDRRISLGSYQQHQSWCRFTEEMRLDYSREQPSTWHQIGCLPSETISLASGLLFIASSWGGIYFLQI